MVTFHTTSNKKPPVILKATIKFIGLGKLIKFNKSSTGCSVKEYQIFLYKAMANITITIIAEIELWTLLTQPVGTTSSKPDNNGNLH